MKQRKKQRFKRPSNEKSAFPQPIADGSLSRAETPPKTILTPAGERVHKTGPEFLVQSEKAARIARTYGAGVKTLEKNLGLTKKEAAKAADKFAETWPGLQQFSGTISGSMRSRGPNMAEIVFAHVPDKVGEIIKDRKSKYGPTPFAQESCAAVWQQILETWFQKRLPGKIPPQLVPLMMNALKMLRAATPFGYQQDSYDDMQGYARIADECERSQREQTGTGTTEVATGDSQRARIPDEHVGDKLRSKPRKKAVLRPKR